jgi:hypothetical protein
MKPDSSIVEEVRRRCMDLSRRFRDDLREYGRHLMELQANYSGRLVDQLTVIPSKGTPVPQRDRT